jgi:hypothetical protein
MHPWAALIFWLLAADLPAQAPLRDASDSLVVTGELPFSKLDLEQAIAVRLLEGSSLPAKLEVIAQGTNRIEVRLGNRRRIVDIGASNGEMVARLVAISVADLLMEIAPAPLRVAPPATVRESIPTTLRLTAMPGLGHGLSNGETYLASFMAAGSARRGKWLVGLGVGYWQTPTVRKDEPGESALVAWPVRASMGVALGRFEFALGPFLAPYNVTGAKPRSGILAGAGLTAIAVFSLPRRLRVLVGGGCEGFFNRTATTVGQSFLTFASPRIAPWLGVGFGWELGS